MFGNKNSAVPYVRIGGVDRQSVLTSNANGNTPVKEIGVNANGNLIFSTDLATFKSVLDLKYSQFKSNDENQDDTWETEKSVSMRASGTLEDGTAKETGVVVSKENDATIYSTNGTSTTQITVTPTGAKVNDKEIATTDKLPDTSKLLTTDTSQTITATKYIKQDIVLNDNIAIIGWDYYGTRNNLIKHYTKSGDVTGKIVVGSSNSSLYLSGESTRPRYGRYDYDIGKDLALLSDVPSVKQSTGTSTTATMSQNAITSAIPTALSQLSEDTTHRVVTDTEKATWNNKSNFDGAFSSLSGVPTASEGTAGIIQIATDQEAENGTNTSKAVNPKQLKTAIDGLGTVFDLKGTKATVQDLPTTGNEIGDVWYVTAEQVGYIWLNDGTTDKWEQFGTPIDLSGYVQYIDIINDLTSTATNKALSAYQGKILNDQMSSLSSQLGSTNSNVSTLQSEVSTLQSKVSTLENDNSTNKSNISTLQTQMASQPTFSLDGTTLTITL